MCGIAGIVSKNNVDSIKESLFKMSQSIKHRGPDGEGFSFFTESSETPAFSIETPKINIESNQFLFNPKQPLSEIESHYKMAFAHRRLSIIDLSESGHQPMCDESSHFWITFNGEIYNYIELKNELQNKGHVFLTKTDTEVVIAAYKEWGTECLKKFNGMWAFALYDKIKQVVFCARDRVGVKPFYYINNNKFFAFASEQKAFLKSNLIPFEINENQQFDFLINAKLETTSESLFKQIEELPPSHYFFYQLNLNLIQLKKYYELSIEVQTFKDEDEIISEIESKLKKAINLRLRSDVEIGSCLSGGLDSSIIAGMIKKLSPDKNLKLFSAVFPSEKFDESVYAKQVSSFVNGNWHSVTPTETEFFKDIDNLIYTQDLPIWSTSTYSQYRVMKLVSENNIKVVLDGQGADELFAGYTQHYFSLWKELGFTSALKNIKDSYQTLKHPYLNFAKQLFKENFDLGVDYKKYFDERLKINTKTDTIEFIGTLNKQLKKDYFGNLKSYLKCEDRNSMAFGIESRVPFSDDVELVDYIFSIKGDKKIKNGVLKYLLREAGKKYIPTSIYNRKDKIGFESPLSKWLTHHKGEIIEKITEQLDFINHSALNTNYNLLLKTKPSFLFRLYSLSVWKHTFKHLS
jgi:asparagine synthase (glutamine-hydrolysing)